MLPVVVITLFQLLLQKRRLASGKRPLGLWDLCLWEQVLVFGKGSLGSFALVDVLRAHLTVL